MMNVTTLPCSGHGLQVEDGLCWCEGNSLTWLLTFFWSQIYISMWWHSSMDRIGLFHYMAKFITYDHL
jgi:hypothetical protein